MFLGLRVSEAIKLHRDNFNKDFTKLTFQPLKKARPIVHERHIPSILSEKLQKYHVKYRRRYRNGYLFFPFKNGSTNYHVQRSTIIWWFKTLRKELGLNQVYFTCSDGKKLYRVSSHTFRHFAAWRYYESSGYNIKAVQEILCHESFETTAKYISSMASLDNELNIINGAWDKL